MSLRIIMGTMFAGKSTANHSTLTRWTNAGNRCVYITSIIDERPEIHGNGILTTHNKDFVEDPRITYVKVSTLSEFTDLSYDCYGIDEFQFFGPEAVEWVKKLLTQHKKQIVCSGLDATSGQELFGHITELIPWAQSVEKLTTWCSHCKYGTAVCTVKVSGQTSSEIDVGSDKYRPSCLACLSVSRQRK